MHKTGKALRVVWEGSCWAGIPAQSWPWGCSPPAELAQHPMQVRVGRERRAACHSLAVSGTFPSTSPEIKVCSYTHLNSPDSNPARLANRDWHNGGDVGPDGPDWKVPRQIMAGLFPKLVSEEATQRNPCSATECTTPQLSRGPSSISEMGPAPLP